MEALRAAVATAEAIAARRFDPYFALIADGQAAAAPARRGRR